MWISFSRKRSPSHWELLKWQVLISLYPWFCVCVCTFLFPQCQLYGLFKKTEYIPSSPHLAAFWPKSQCSSQKIQSHIAGVTKGLDSTFWRVPWKEFFYDWRNHQIQHSRCPDTSVICYLASENFGDKIRCLAFFSQLFIFLLGQLELHEMIVPTIASHCCQMTEKEKLKLNLGVLSFLEHI